MRAKRLCKTIIISLMVIAIIVGTFIIQSMANSVFTPVSILQPTIIGHASYYSYECANQPMANGKIFNPEKRTCASWFYKFGTRLKVKSLDTGKVTEVVVTDRGPNKRLVRQGRIIDLSKRAFEDICDLSHGLTKVAIDVKG